VVFIKHINTALFLILTFFVLILFLFNNTFQYLPVSNIGLSTKVYSWYYEPHETGMQPLPMKRAEYIINYNYLYAGDPKEKIIYLTFDDSPNGGNIPEILDILKKHNACASFFMNEGYIRKNPDVINRLIDEGSIVCNHTSNHVVSANLSIESLEEELKGVENAYRDVTGLELPKYFRPPEGKFNEVLLCNLNKLGYTAVFWSFDYVDWKLNKQPRQEEAFELMINSTHPGEILLLHTQSETNVNILDRIITAWEEQGYTFGTVDRIRTIERRRESIPV
jgi:peptidoglycan-N-acetylmuramic acid deacetylase